MWRSSVYTIAFEFSNVQEFRACSDILQMAFNYLLKLRFTTQILQLLPKGRRETLQVLTAYEIVTNYSAYLQVLGPSSVGFSTPFGPTSGSKTNGSHVTLNMKII